ncbi:DUF3613 domain-containing protein [Paraburkholderia hayleyella]|uniref:DUF3613 domain-containing protein n=1 Tax=Paraburkholderia hayleyella TaxID=2152889 RepID=UPI001FE8758B|nr:DUF3613 domain-containing protein [Paraburkholderia hayleyella]
MSFRTSFLPAWRTSARWLLCMGMLSVSFTAGAQIPTEAPFQEGAKSEPRVSGSEAGYAARAWLTLQSSNAAAAPALPMLGAEAGLAYQRYLDSFKTKIPALFGSSMESVVNGDPLRGDYHNSGSAQN